MRPLRYLYVLALVMWLGGMSIAGLVVAPTTFGVLEAWNPTTGRVLAGQVFGAILARMHLVAYVAGAAMVLVLTVQRLLGPRPRSYGIRVGLLGLMLALTIYSGVLIAPRIDQLQAEVAGPMSTLAAERSAPRRVRSSARSLDGAGHGDARRRAGADGVGNEGVKRRKCGVRSAECEVRATCGVRSPCEVRSAKCEVRSAKCRSASAMTIDTDLGVLVRQAIDESTSSVDAMERAVAMLKDGVPAYTWVGIYLVEGDELVLGPFLGKPSPHTRIPLGKGICGAAASQAQTIIVDDVNADPRYLACSLETRSEIVVPIIHDGRVLGEIDIDSDKAAAFGPADRDLLEAVAGHLARRLAAGLASN